jgi:DNA-directed RNA polymerase specialized sigma24 family protein
MAGASMKTDVRAPDTRSDPADDFPVLEELRSLDEKTSQRAWERAYPVLWREAMLTAHGQLTGARFEQDREDLAAQALSQFQQRVIRGADDFRNQGKSPRDGMCSMLCFIVQRRVVDFFRAKSPEEPMDTVPEPELEAGRDIDTLCQTVREAAASLDPPLPELFADRLEGLTAEETAARRGMNRNTVLSHWRRGMKELRLVLGELDF